MGPLMHTTFIKHRSLIFKIGAVFGFLLLALLLYVSAKHLYTPDDLEQIERERCLRIAMDNSDFGYNKEGGGGFAYEIAQRLADSLQVRLEVVLANGVDNQMALLKKRKVHAVFTLTPKSSAYHFHLSYSHPLFLARYVLAQQLSTDTPISSPDRLIGKSITLSDNAPATLCVEHLSEMLADKVHVVNTPLLSEQELVVMVARGEVAYTLVSNFTAKRWSALYPNVDFSMQVGFTQQHCFAYLESSEDWGHYLNGFIKAYMNTPAYGELFQRYFNAMDLLVQ